AEQPEGKLARLLARARARGARIRLPPELCAGEHTFGSAHARVLWPCPAFDAGWDPNDNSFVVELRFARRRMLFTGDVEAHGEASLLAEGQLVPVDVLKVAHHGSRTSSNPALLEVLRPRVAVVSTGRHSRFG